MTFSLSFTVPGAPVAKGRPRLSNIGGKARAFTPAKTVRYEQLVALAAQQAMDGRAAVRDVPLVVRVVAYVPIPASWSARKQAAATAGTVKPISRPDADNFLKAGLDGMNGVVFHDDAQVVHVVVAKHYSLTPGMEISVAELGA